MQLCTNKHTSLAETCDGQETLCIVRVFLLMVIVNLQGLLDQNTLFDGHGMCIVCRRTEWNIFSNACLKTFASLSRRTTAFPVENGIMDHHKEDVFFISENLNRVVHMIFFGDEASHCDNSTHIVHRQISREVHLTKRRGDGKLILKGYRTNPCRFMKESS